MTEAIQVKVPDIGGAKDVDVIELLVKAGDDIAKDQSLITLEGDKATMEIPSPFDGVVDKVLIKLGEKVSQGSIILTLLPTGGSPIIQDKEENNIQEAVENAIQQAPVEQVIFEAKVAEKPALTFTETAPDEVLGASPSVRRLARELGISLEKVAGTGRKSRIMKEDIQAYVKNALNNQSSTTGFNLPKADPIDFTQFGEIEAKPLNKIKRLTGTHVHRAWVTIPHVTQFDEADITELEAFRKEQVAAQKDTSYKLTLLAFVCKVVCKALKVYPQFNASLDASGEQLIYKKYFNIGIATETPDGLVVPVIKNIDQLSVIEIAQEMGVLSKKAREKGLLPRDLAGGCFSISSLGGIGGTAFTPIVNSPEAAILGLSRSSIKPIYDGKEFQPRLMLPLSLSYDHRIIDGAEAARFTRYIADALGDIRRILL